MDPTIEPRRQHKSNNGETYSDIKWNSAGRNKDTNAENYGLSLHRCILAARSAYFRALFTAGLRESRSDQQVLPPEISFSQFRRLIQTIYSGELSVPDEELLRYLELAHRYQVDDALRLVQRRLGSFVNELTLVDLAEASILFSLAPLRDLCVCHALVHWEVLKSEVCDRLPQELRDEIEELRRVGCSLQRGSPRRIELVIMSKFPAPRDESDTESSDETSSNTDSS